MNRCLRSAVALPLVGCFVLTAGATLKAAAQMYPYADISFAPQRPLPPTPEPREPPPPPPPPRPSGAADAAAKWDETPHYVAARFTLGDGQRYQVNIPLAPPPQGDPRRSIVSRAGLSVAAGMFCLMLMTVFLDFLSTSKKKYQRIQQQRAAQLFANRRKAALYAMRQAAELLLELQKQQENVQQQRECILAAQRIESKISDIEEDFPRTTEVARLLIKRLLEAAGAQTLKHQERQQQQQQQQGQQEQQEQYLLFRDSRDRWGTAALPAFDERLGSAGKASSNKKLKKHSSLYSLSSEYGGYLDDGTSEKDWIDAYLENWLPSGPLGARGSETLVDLLMENRDLSNKDALSILAALEGKSEGLLSVR